ncbi:hypothetical protein JW968_00325 [Candidatus Woesearchaeota archaeon]|nr:hypothetical protein [Candidatus Woesearchaeota archaeon]
MRICNATRIDSAMPVEATQMAASESCQHSEEKQSYVNPSLGQIGVMYHDSRNDRIKYFSTDIHTSPNSVDDLVDEGLRLASERGTTRLNARFLCTEECSYDGPIEARIPLNNGFTGLELIYVGINSSERTTDPKTRADEDRLVAVILSSERSSRETTPGYSIHHLTAQNTTESDISDMVRLYAEAFTTYTTVLDAENVRRMIDNSVVYAVRNPAGRIVSTVVAEIGEVPTERGIMRITELSEMATLRECRGSGLVTLATEQLVEDIRDRVDLIYAEARAPHAAINKSFHNMGFSYAGRLDKQCILSGDREIAETGPYENLNVWYMLPHDD